MNSHQFRSIIQDRGFPLTDEQWEAVSHPLSTLAVFAGPGSGKTTVITLRAAYLHLVEGLSPEEMLVFTFTRKSAYELKQRLQQLHPVLSRVNAGTFHSIFLLFYSKYRGIQPQLLTDGENRRLLRQVMKNGARNPEDESVEEALQIITRVKNSSTTPETLMAKDHQDWLSVYKRYEAMKQQMGRWDFDDILLQFYHQLADRRFLEWLRSHYRSVMVDEFQDTSLVQWKALEKLCERQIPLTVVGDDDQSIYAFRGAESGVIRLFLSMYKDAKEVVLGKNFRSIDPIIATASRLIGHNAQRRKKNFEGMIGDGAAPTLREYADDGMEALGIAKIVSERIQVAQHTIGILARTNYQLYPVVEALWQQGISFVVHDPSVLPYRQFDVQSMLKWLSVAAGLASTADAQQAFQQFLLAKRIYKINDESIFRTRASSSGEWLKLLVIQNPLGVGREFGELLTHWSTLDAKSAYLEAWRTYHPFYEMRKKSRRDDKGEMAVLLVAKGIPHKQRVFEWVLAVKEREQQLTKQAAPIQVLTMHGAKGLEFDEVFLLGLHDRALPHQRVHVKKNNLTDSVEEERRLFYVGCTRAKKKLWLSYPKKEGSTPVNPSPFIEELGFSTGTMSERKGIGQAHGEYNYEVPKQGAACLHQVFGEGTIVAVSPFLDQGYKVVIQFLQSGSKTFYWEKAIQFGHLKLKS